MCDIGLFGNSCKFMVLSWFEKGIYRIAQSGPQTVQKSLDLAELKTLSVVIIGCPSREDELSKFFESFCISFLDSSDRPIVGIGLFDGSQCICSK